MRRASIGTLGSFGGDGVKKAHVGHSLVSPGRGACPADMQTSCFDCVRVGCRDIAGRERR